MIVKMHVGLNDILKFSPKRGDFNYVTSILRVHCCGRLGSHPFIL